MKRRSFFQSLVKTAAIVALAPQLAFRVRPELPNLVWRKGETYVPKYHCISWGPPPGMKVFKVTGGEWQEVEPREYLAKLANF